MTDLFENPAARTFAKIVLLLTIVTFVASCGGRRARAEKRASTGSSCTAPVVGPCPSCSISCPVGQPASCLPGAATGPTCTTPPACKCN